MMMMMMMIIIIIIMGVRTRCSSKGLCKNLDILPVPCLYIYSLIMFVVNNHENFRNNSSLHCKNTTTKKIKQPYSKSFVHSKIPV